MKPIKINFAPLTFARFFIEVPVLAWLGFIALIVVSIIVCSHLVELNTQLQKTQNEIHLAQNTLSNTTKKNVTKDAINISDAQAQSINAAIFQLNLPWNELFDALESATPSHIALLAIEPEAKKNFVKGTAEAKTSEDMIAYIRLLKQQKFLIDVVLLKHEVMEQDINKPLRFQFLAQWESIEK